MIRVMMRVVSFLAGAVVLQFVSVHAYAACRAISSAPTVINQPGVYCLTRNQTVNISSGVAIDIQSPDVTLDLSGYVLENQYTDLDSTAIGIASGSNSAVTVKNGSVRGFRVGINMAGPSGLPLGNVVEAMRVTNTIETGIRMGTTNSVVRDNFVSFVGDDSLAGACGILVDLGGSSQVIGNRIFEIRGSTDATAICFDGGSGVVENNTTEEIRIDISPGVNGPVVKADNTGFTSSVIVTNNRFIGESSWTAGSTAVVSVSGPSSVAVCRDNVITFYATSFSGCVDGGGNTVVP